MIRTGKGAIDLIKSRSMMFLHPTIVASSDPVELDAIIRAVGYFRNYPVFKSMYSLAYKSRYMQIKDFKEFYKDLSEYSKSHEKDFFLRGFFDCIRRSNRKIEKGLITCFVEKFLFPESTPVLDVGDKFVKSVGNYYSTDRPIKLASIVGNKVIMIDESNIVKYIMKAL